MKIAIDISQCVYEGTGVARYVSQLIRQIISQDKVNEYILFGSSLRLQGRLQSYYQSLKLLNNKIKLVLLPLPPTVLDIIWNRWHIFPVEWFVGQVDVFWSSDWTQPPLSRANGVTTIHDLTVFRYPESFAKSIIDVHLRRLNWAVSECSMFFCDSQATKRDAHDFLKIPNEQLRVVYPGI